ncbi:MAG: hypothetical protein H7X88_05845, partial [Gloeobacteraceae cyanobacterium ES-bin-316]|nr:hypothetical protein [Ferruginibacter sp.]
MKNFYHNIQIRWVFAATVLCVFVLVWEANKNLRYVYKDNTKVKSQVEEIIFYERIITHVSAMDSGQRS